MDERFLKRQGSAWQRWLNKYGVEVVESGGELTLKVQSALSRLRSDPLPTVNDVLDEGMGAWRDAGRDVYEFRKAKIKFRTGDGERVSGIVGANLR